ncbi:MAG: hypothetical protein DRG30_10390, partial [Epsilonproteobacteria bacterium]
MARTQVTEQQIKDRSITGASFVPEMMYYDETANYSTNNIINWAGKQFIANTNITGIQEGDLTQNPTLSSDWDELEASIYSVYPSTTQTFTNTRVDVTFDTVRFTSPSFTIASNEITFNSSGTFMLNLTISVDNIDNNRATAYSFVQIDTGSGYADIPSLSIYNYSRSTSDGSDTSSITIPYTFNTGDKLKVQIISNSTVQLATRIAGCNISLFPIKAVSGPKGDLGAVGPSGDLNWLGDYNSGTIYT